MIRFLEYKYIILNQIINHYNINKKIEINFIVNDNKFNKLNNYLIILLLILIK